MTTSDRPRAAIQTGPYVDRIVRIFRDKPYDDTTALVLIDFAQAELRAATAAPAVDRSDALDIAEEDAALEGTTPRGPGGRGNIELNKENDRDV